MRLSLVLLFLQVWGNVKVSLSQNACSTLPDVAHSYISEETKKAQYHTGDVVHFTCEIGYISGLTVRYICTINGWLAIHKGRCYLKPCELPDDTPNGYYQIIQGEDFVFGTTIKYFCNEGYQMVSKDDTRTCYLDKWSNHVPICDPLSCDPPLADGGITVKGLPENENPILPDRFLTFSCDGPGKYLNGSSILICGKDGQWDKPFPSCEDITCKVDVMHPHLKVVGAPANKTIKTGHKLQFFCDDDYTLDGPEEIECLESGQWNVRFPTCSDRCTVKDVPGNVRLHKNMEGTKLGKGEKLRFYCFLRGHILQGKQEVECLANGQWSDPFPTCGAPLGCRNPPHLADGDTRITAKFQYRHNERVEYICQRYYTMESGPYKTCNNGEWTGEMRCLKPCTVDEEVMRTHNIAFRYTYQKKLYSPHDDELEFKCTGRRIPISREGMRQKCLDGVMHLPTCI